MQLDDLVKRRNALRKAHPIRNFRPKKKAATLRDGLEKTREPDRREGSVGTGAPGCGNRLRRAAWPQSEQVVCGAEASAPLQTDFAILPTTSSEISPWG